MKLKGFMHINSETDFSNLLSKYNYMQVNIEKLSLKPSMGFYDFIKNIGIPLKCITIYLPMSEFSQYQIIKVLKGTNTVIQYVDNITKGGSSELSFILIVIWVMLKALKLYQTLTTYMKPV